MVLILHVFGLIGLLQAVMASPASRNYHETRRTARQALYQRNLDNASLNETGPVIVHGAFTVELEDGASADDLGLQLDALDITIQTRRVMDSSLFKGLSFDVVNSSDDYNDATTESTIRSVAAVKQVWPVRRVTLPPGDKGSLIDLARVSTSNDRRGRDLDEPYVTHAMTQVDLVHKTGITGKGVRIAVLDTGIDYSHPLLGGCFGRGCLVESGWDSIGVDYVTDDQVGPGDDDPMDCHGHGTHVAGIISALPNDFGFEGVAPGAVLSAYRVLDCRGWATDEHIVDGMLRAFDEGNDLLTISLGGPGGWPESVMSITATRIIEAGVPVFIAVGNSGLREGMFEPGSPSDGDLVTSVASLDPLENPIVANVGSFSSGDDEPQGFDWSPVQFSFDDSEQVTLPVIDLNSFVTSNNSKVTGCSPLPSNVPDLSGFLVLVEQEYTRDIICWWDELQQENIFARGGSNIIFWSDDEDLIGENYPINDDINVGWMLSSSSAKALRQVIAGGSNTTVTLGGDIRVSWSVNEETGGEVSAFSSWGPNWDMRVAPSVGAPGHNILSTWLDERAVILGGTSMSTPFVAGAAALLIEARGTRDPTAIQSLLAGTARQVPLSAEVSSARGGVHPPTQAGAGLVQVLDAIQVKGVLSTTGISFNDSYHRVDEVTFTLKNTGSKEATYQLGHTAAVTTYALHSDHMPSLSPFGTLGSTASLSFSSDKVKISAGGEANITVRCEPPRGGDASRWPIYSGYITLNGTNGDNLAVSYVGNAGSMREGIVITDDMVWAEWEHDEVYTIPRPVAGEVPSEDIGWTEDRYPYMMADTMLRTRQLRVDLLPATVSPNGTHTSPCHRPREEWLGRKTFGQIWGSPRINQVPSWIEHLVSGHMADGGVAPEGRYSLMVSALGVFRDATSNSTDDWQVVETAPFVLKYKG